MFFNTSIISKAKKNKLFEVELYKLNDFSENKTKRVDDKAYWMHGQVISVLSLSKAIDFIFEKVWSKIPVIYMTPSGYLLNQENVEKYFISLC